MMKSRYISNPNPIGFKLLLPLLLFAIMTAACTTNRGYFGVGNPTVLNNEKTRLSLSNQQKEVINTTRLEAIDPFAINQTYLLASNIEKKGSVTIITPAPGAAKAPVPKNDLATPSAPSDPTPIITIAGPEKYSGLVVDGFTSLESYSAHKINSSEKLDPNMMGIETHDQIYKIKFDLWIEPVRQNYTSYIWRWLPAIFSEHGFRNYTKDYHAEINFHLGCSKSENKPVLEKTSTPENTPTPINTSENNEDCPFKVVLVQPTHEGINSFNMALQQETSQFALFGSWLGSAAGIDLSERHKEQLVQQRKDPVLRGIIDSKADFRFLVSPRIHVEQRTFRIPFLMSRYSIERGLESGPYTVSAYILVKPEVKLPVLKVTIRGDYKLLGSAARSDIEDRAPIYPIREKYTKKEGLVPERLFIHHDISLDRI